MTTTSRNALAALVAVLAACGGDDDPRRAGLGGRCRNTSGCQDPLVCVDGTCGLGNVGAECTAQASCSEGLLCHLGTCQVSEPPSASCATPGAPPAIVSGGTLVADEPAAGVCTLASRPPDPGTGPTQVITIGPRPVGSRVDFTLPEGSTGFTIVSQEQVTPGTTGTAVESVTLEGTQRVPNSVVPTLIRDPSGALLWDDIAFPDDPTTAFIYYGGVTQTAGALTAPNTPRLLDRLYTEGSLPAGGWSFFVNDFAHECTDSRLGALCGTSGSSSGVYDVHVLTRSGPLASTGTLDLAVYLVTDSLTAAAAPANASFRRMMSSIATILGRGGLCVGTVTVFDVPAWARDRYRNVIVDDDPATPNLDEGGVCGPLAQMFTLSRGGNALQLFLVDDISQVGEDPGEFSIAGIDGSIPGPSAVNGTVNSGAAVALGTSLTEGQCLGNINLNACGADFLAYIAAHEIGHWLGLYHATEASGEFFDPLTDTATCACSACAPLAQRPTCSSGSQSMTAPMCNGATAACRGADNLMFWIVDQPISVGNLTRQQGQVVRLNPAVR